MGQKRRTCRAQDSEQVKIAKQMRRSRALPLCSLPADLSKSKEGPCRPQHANDLIITHLTTNYPHRSIKRAPPYKPLMAPLCRCTDKGPFLTNHLRSCLAVRIMQNPDVTKKKLKKKRHINTAGMLMKGFLLLIVSTITGYTQGS